MKIEQKYWRVARALALYYWDDPDIADRILEAANGDTYEPYDNEIAGVHDAAIARESSELPDYVDENG